MVFPQLGLALLMVGVAKLHDGCDEDDEVSRNKLKILADSIITELEDLKKEEIE